MNYFTVPMKYHHKTRLGNWYEEWELEETRMKDYLKKHEQNHLESEKTERKLLHSLQKASLSYVRDAYLHFDDHVTLYNLKTQGLLGCDVYDRIAGNDESYSVTSSTLIGPCARSVFVLKRYEKDMYQDNFIHYGQKVRIIANPRLLRKTFYLQSLPITNQNCAKFSRKQEVSITAAQNFNSVWIIEYSDPKIRFEMSGQPVKANDSILLKHSFTAQWLASDNISYRNDFGVEYEVFGHSFQKHNKTQNLIAEKCGRTTIDVPMRNQNEQNLWEIRTAKSPSEEFDENSLDKPITAYEIIGKIRSFIEKRGVYGIRNLAKGLKNLDPEKKESLDFDDFKWGLRNAGLFLAEEELRILLNELDRTNKGLIDYTEFLYLLRGNIGQHRIDLIRQAFEKIDEKFKGKATLEDLGKLFNANKHPDILSKKKTEEEIFKEFILNWDSQNKDYIINFRDFVNYYQDLSALIDRDDYFENMMTHVWGLNIL